MSTLVKSSDGVLQGRIRTFRRASPASEVVAWPAAVPDVPAAVPAGEGAADKEPPSASETEMLQSRIDVLEAELERVRGEAGLECEKRFEEGRAAGMLEAEKAERERLEILGQAAATMSGKADEAFRSLEALGATLAGVAVGKVLGDRDVYRQAVEDVIARQMAAIRPEVVSGLRLSANDFPDDAAISELAARHGLAIEIDPQLEAGGCIFDLSLGRLDASLGRQRDAILALLDEHADGNASE